jgi:hypothetical protein
LESAALRRSDGERRTHHDGPRDSRTAAAEEIVDRLKIGRM